MCMKLMYMPSKQVGEFDARGKTPVLRHSPSVRTGQPNRQHRLGIGHAHDEAADKSFEPARGKCGTTRLHHDVANYCFEMPRNTHRHRREGIGRGISKGLACVMTGVNDRGDCFCELSCRGATSTWRVPFTPGRDSFFECFNGAPTSPLQHCLDWFY